MRIHIFLLVRFLLISIYINFCCRSKERKKYFKMSRSTKRFVFFFRIYLFISFLYTCMFPACCFHQRTYMAEGIVNVGDLNSLVFAVWMVFSWLWVYSEVTPLFFSECAYLNLLSLIFDMFLSLCVLEWFRISLTVILCVSWDSFCVSVVVWFEIYW